MYLIISSIILHFDFWIRYRSMGYNQKTPASRRNLFHQRHRNKLAAFIHPKPPNLIPHGSMELPPIPRLQKSLAPALRQKFFPNSFIRNFPNFHPLIIPIFLDNLKFHGTIDKHSWLCYNRNIGWTWNSPHFRGTANGKAELFYSWKE